MFYEIYNAFTGIFSKPQLNTLHNVNFQGSQIQSYKRYIPYQKSYFYNLNFRTLGTKKPIVLRSEKSNIKL